jgi:hypothetical protein
LIYYNPASGGFLDTVIHGKNLPSGLIEVSNERRAAIIAARANHQVVVCEGGVISFQDPPPPTLAELADQERTWRNAELALGMRLRDRHRDQLEIEVQPTLSGDQFKELLLHIQALRDWPQSPDFPQSAYRPVAPPWITEQTP